MNRANRLAWMEVVEGGDGPAEGGSFEVACLVTEGDLSLVAEGPLLRLGAAEEASSVESALLGFLRQHCPEGKVPLSGHDVPRVREVLRQRLAGVDAFLHYRVVDVSTVRALVATWLPEVARLPVKVGAGGTAMARIRETLEELRHYRQHAFR